MLHKFGTGGWSQAADVYEITSLGVFRTKLSDVELKPRLPQLKYPFKEGETWSLEVTLVGKGEVKYAFTAGKKEKVKVKAGEFEAIPVLEEATFGGRTRKMTNWYAPGVGIVKYTIPLGNTLELQSYEPGK